MASFITTPSRIFTFRRNIPPLKCSFHKNQFPCIPLTSNPVMQTTNFSPNDELDDEDDDATMGSAQGTGAYGIRTPPLTPSEKIYLDGAKNNKEYMARIMEIARRKDLNRSTQTPDQYVESLSSTKQSIPQGDYGGPRIDAADEYLENLARTYRKGKGIQDIPLPKNRRPSTSPPGPVVDPNFLANPPDSVAQLEDKMRTIQAEIEQASQGLNQAKDPSVAQEVMEKLNQMAKTQQTSTTDIDQTYEDDITLEEGARQIAELQKQIQQAAGLDYDSDSQPNTVEVTSEQDSEPQVDLEPESEPELDTQSDAQVSGPSEPLRQPNVGKDPGTVDKQIEFLESYVSKLQKEASEDPDAKQQDDLPEEPKRDFGEDLQATISTVADQISKMPSERTMYQGLENTPGEMSVEEKMAMFEQLRHRSTSSQPSTEFTDPFNVKLPERNSTSNIDSGDEPSPESEAEYDSFESSVADKSLLIEEIETEIKAYSRDLKALLQKHETRLQVLLTRLRIL